MKKKCENCGRKGKIYCESDETELCWDCDEYIHTRNIFGQRHIRCLLCCSCQSLTPWKASGTKIGAAFYSCDDCRLLQANQHQNQNQETNTNNHNHNDHEEDEEDEEMEDEYTSDDTDEDEDEDEEYQVVPSATNFKSPSSSPPPSGGGDGSFGDGGGFSYRF